MSYKSKKIFLSKEILINSSGQICVKNRFILKFIYRHYRFVI